MNMLITLIQDLIIPQYIYISKVTFCFVNVYESQFKLTLSMAKRGSPARRTK